MCGFKNAVTASRCVSCGAKVDASGGDYTEEEELAKRHQQDGFEWKWVAVASFVYLAFQALILVALPFVVSTYDPQGIAGLGISALVWFVGGVVVGVVSPGKTFIEPAVGAFFAVIPTIAYLMFITPNGFNPSLLAYMVGGLLGVMMSLFGAFIGEKVQMNTRGHAKTS